MSASLLVVPLSASPILVMGCLEVGAVVLIMAELVAEVKMYFAEVPPRRLHGNATSRDTSRRIGVGAGEVVDVDLRHHPPNVLKVAILPFKVRLAGPVVLWWKELQDYALVPAVITESGAQSLTTSWRAGTSPSSRHRRIFFRRLKT